MNIYRGLAALVMWCSGMAAHGACELSLSEAALDFGPLHPPPGGRAWQSAARQVRVDVLCEPDGQPGFYLQGEAVDSGWAFGDGSLQVSLGQAQLDGRPVALLRRGGRALGPGAKLAPNDAWIAPEPGRRLQVQLFIEARLPPQAWQARDAYQARGQLLIRVL